MTPIRRPPKITPLPAAEPSADTPAILRRPPAITPSSASPLLQPLPKPAPTPVPAINMTKTQQLPVHPPASGIQPAPVIITSKPLAPLDAIPRPLCWAVLGISALIFLIQIWNYVVS
jgi:hypothetical protein